MQPLYSICIPVYNEEGNILPLIQEIENAMRPYEGKWELILVNDGSKDGTKKELEAIQKKHIRPVHFVKNAGQTAALDCAFKMARGEYVITMDADGQNDPKDIPKLIDLIGDCDIVTGIRTIRQDSLIKRLISTSANAIRSFILDDKTSDTGCSLKVMRKDMLMKIKLYKGMHRFLPALFLIEGGKTKEVPVNHRKRQKGDSKYSLFSRGPALVSDLFCVRWMKNRHLNYEVEHGS